MEQLNLSKSRQLAENWLDDHRREALAAAPEEERRLLETLYARQRSSLEYLQLIQLDQGAPAREEAEPEKWLIFLSHPIIDVLLPVLVLAFVLLDLELAAVISGILSVLRGLLIASNPALRRGYTPVLHEVHEPYLPVDQLTRFLQQQTDRIAVDAASITERQAVTLIRERQDVGEDAVELYCALYEAALDVSDPEPLSYPLSILKASLWERGLEPVPYTADTAALFDVMPGDSRSEMRWPAIRSRDSGAVLKRGLYFLRRPQ